MAWAIDNRKYDDETEELAYQLWAFKCSRRVSDVVRLLDDGRERVPDVATVRRWVREQDWPAKVRNDIRSIAPDLTEQTVVDLIVGRAESVTYLRRVVQVASEPEPLLDRNLLATDAETGEKVRVLATFRPNKDAIAAAIALMDRGGLSHVGNGADPESKLKGTIQGAAQALELRGRSVDELMRLEAELRTKAKPASR